MALYQVSVLKKYLKLQDDKIIDKAYKKFTSYFQHPEIQENIRKSKEEQFQATFLNELFVNILGYKLNPNPNYNLTTEFKNDSNNRKADGAILQKGNAIGVIELKGTNTKHLEGIRQQAFDYKANQKNCVYVITSNFEKLRFYINDATEFLEFDLFELNRDDFGLLWLCLHHDNIMNGLPLKIKEASLVEEEVITKEFYKDYSVFKRELYRDLVKKNAKELKSIRQSELASESLADEEFQQEVNKLEKNVKLNLFKKSQKLIDRFLFVFFAEDRGLLPPNSIHKIIQNWEMLQDMDVEQSLYERYKIYFNYLNTGREAKGDQAEIFAYNGGLFKPDPILDILNIDNEVLVKHTKKLATYDFESQVDVNILGHIFENSLNEIESVNAGIEGADFDKQKSKRKKDGVFYTPKYITKYIVENTVGKLCNEKKSVLGFREEEYYKGRKRRKRETLEQLLKILDDYREWLLKLTICDPACGSGAFLNQALDFLIKEHRYIDEMHGKLLGESFRFPGIENTILENNIYGVDINEESVEIARLSLWLRTAKPHRKLNDLSSNIKCGNSLIDNKKVAGDKAFKWEEEFPEVFKNGGFDVVIGNPPYVFARENFSQVIKDYYVKNYVAAEYQINLYLLFIERTVGLIKEKSNYGLIIPNAWLMIDSARGLRNYLLNNCKIDQIINLSGYSFEGVNVETIILLGTKKINFSDSDKVKVLLSNRKEFKFSHSRSLKDFKNNDGFEFKVFSDESSVRITEKLKQNSENLDDLVFIKAGLQAYEKNKGEPKQTAEDVKNRPYDYTYQFDENTFKYLEGRDVGRYQIDWSGGYLQYGNQLAAPRTFNLFNGDKIIIREITGKFPNCIISTFEENIYLYNRSNIGIVERDNKAISLKYILAILNSKLLSYYFIKNTAKSVRKMFPKIILNDLRKFPFKEVSLEEQKPFIQLADTILNSNNEFLNSLKKFQNYLLSQFSVKKLSKKLENWHTLNFGEFIKELNKVIHKENRERRKIEQDELPILTKKDEFEWMELFEENKKKAVELQEQINSTDKEIDQMVYELYGLTEEEIAIVETV
ncbi:N-6 DNA methylase [Salegentibacter mishustinae]|uniref:Eco57I restriction-modification methylase domain-containing protein n=1 Tax=Salegentibacter mishustinae TaxID=270918 RepID=UPI001CE1C5D6|nr:TaqI-like C-terminal specificity domain-containing protein [Salegentibacter mishustinae]UBZ08783.1 N-6 DNA methylase [Salegentibacter mishustinae]